MRNRKSSPKAAVAIAAVSLGLGWMMSMPAFATGGPSDLPPAGDNQIRTQDCPQACDGTIKCGAGKVSCCYSVPGQSQKECGCRPASDTNDDNCA